MTIAIAAIIKIILLAESQIALFVKMIFQSMLAVI